MRCAAVPRAQVLPPVHSAVQDEIARVASLGGNPSSVHRFGQRARVTVDGAEQEIRALTDLHPATFAYVADVSEATVRLVGQLYSEQDEGAPFCVLFVGCASRWQHVVGAWQREHPGHIAYRAEGVLWRAPGDGEPPHQRSVDDARGGDAVDVVVCDVFCPLTGKLRAVSPALATGAHVHRVFGAFDSLYGGERALASAAKTADSLAISSACLLGPAGLALLLRRGAAAALPKTGSLPTALIAGLAVAARRWRSHQKVWSAALLARRDAWRHARGERISDSDEALASLTHVGLGGARAAEAARDLSTGGALVPLVKADGTPLGALGALWPGVDASLAKAQDDAIFAVIAAAHNHESQ